MRKRRLVLGVNKGRTLSGKDLRLGGAAVASEGEIVFALAEERVTGKKWAGGYTGALRQATAYSKGNYGRERRVEYGDFDVVAVSTCCESEQAGAVGHLLADHPGLRTVNHHISHASVAFFPSNLEPALVCVIDGGGTPSAATALFVGGNARGNSIHTM